MQTLRLMVSSLLCSAWACGGAVEPTEIASKLTPLIHENTPRTDITRRDRVFGAGEVEWQIDQPYSGFGFSVLPEDYCLDGARCELIEATAKGTVQEIDLIFNKSWGCNVALKVENDCKVWSKPTGLVSNCFLPRNGVYYVFAYDRANWYDKWPKCPL